LSAEPAFVQVQRFEVDLQPGATEESIRRIRAKAESLATRAPHDLRFAEYQGQNEHEHCVFCWKEFQVQTDEPWRRGEREYLQYGFRTDDGNNWLCEECYYAVRDILEFTAEVD
jgi:hypothetical protein